MSKHESVLLDETITALELKEDGVYVDATLGYAGHSGELLKRVKRGYLFAFDQDRCAINYSNEYLRKIGDNFKTLNTNFENITEYLSELEITEIDGIMFDLGVSSPQLDQQDRGFSYHMDAPLDMRMDQRQNKTAYTVVNEYDHGDLIRIFRDYGEEKYAVSIAKTIVKAREEAPIKTTLELVQIIKRSMPEKVKKGKHPARKVFQAIRIEVNRELEILRNSVSDAIKLLRPGGIIAVITFHSLEDRIIKVLFNELSEIDPIYKGMPDIPADKHPILADVKRIFPSKEEIEINNRSRSAILRVARKNR